MASTVEDLKQELAEVERQIAAGEAEIKLLKQYKKSIELAKHLKQKVEGKAKPAPAKMETPETKSGAENA